MFPSPFSFATLLCALFQISLASAFYLVTTSCRTQSSNSSSLPDVSALSLFDPYYQPNYLLRTIEAGYLSLPEFTLVNGTLSTPSSGPHGIGNYIFNSTKVVAGSELQFLAQPTTEPGNISLKKDYLVAVNGKAKGWTICSGDLSQEVLFWKGTDPSCKPTYLQAVSEPPY